MAYQDELSQFMGGQKSATSSASGYKQQFNQFLSGTPSAKQKITQPKIQANPIQQKPAQKILKITPTQKNIFETVQKEAQKLIKIGTGTVLSFTQPKVKTPLQKQDNVSPTIRSQTPQSKVVSPIPQKDVVQSKPIQIQPGQKKLTTEQMQQIKPDFGQPKQAPSASVTNTKQQRQQQEKILAQTKIPKQVAKKAADTLRKASLDFIDSFSGSNPNDPFVLADKGDGTPVTKAEWKKMDTKQKIGAIANLPLNAFALPAGEVIQMSKGFSKLGAAIGVGTNTIIKYLNDPEHSIKEAIINPENVIFGILGGKLGSGKGTARLEEVLPAKDYTPQEVIGTVIKNGLETTPEGKTLVKTATEAQQKGQNVTVKHTSPQVQTFEQNVQDYRSYGGKTAGKRTENAALRDITKATESPEIKTYTTEKVKSAIDTGELKTNEDGTITLYRGGEPSKTNGLVSATYDKAIAEKFAKVNNAPLNEFKVKPEDIQAFIGKAEKEVLVKNETVKPNVAQQSISDVKFYRGEGGNNQFQNKTSFISGKNFATDAERAKTFGNVTEYTLDPKAKVLKIDTVGKELDQIAKELGVSEDDIISPNALNRELKKKGYDAVIYKTRLGNNGKLDPNGKIVEDVIALNDDAFSKVKSESIGDVKPEEVVTRTFDAKGNETTGKQGQRVLNTKEVEAVKKSIGDRIEEIGASATSEKDVEDGFTNLYNTIVRESNNDKVVLSALRTQLNKEMYAMAGATSGNFKENFKILQTIKNSDSPSASTILKLEKYVEALDQKLLTAQEPQRITPLGSEKVKVIERNKPLEPVGSGDTKTSKFAGRIEQSAVEKGLTDTFGKLPEYQKANMKEQASMAIDLLKTDFQKAVQIALGNEVPTNGLLPEIVLKVVKDYAVANNDLALMKQLAKESNLSRQLTAMGQRIRAAGEFDKENPVDIMQGVIDNRRQRIEEKYNKSVSEITKDTVKQIKEKVKAPDKYDWNSFVDSIQC